jgi:hypothetical protein
MKNLTILFATLFTLGAGSVSAQVYNEEDIRQQLDKYIADPKQYYDKMKEVNTKADKANENTLKISEEYLALLDKKDSLLKMYKTQLAKVKSASSTTSSAPATSMAASTPVKPTATVTQAAVVPKANLSVAPKSPYRVQLAAFYRDDFSKFFGTFNKTIGVEKLDDRNVIEIQGFKDEAEATEFSQKIKKLGFGGAFVSKYEDGVRQDNYAGSKNGTKFDDGVERAVATKIDYPSYKPMGVQEIKGIKSTPSNPTTTAASKPVPKIEYPSSAPVAAPQLKNPSILKKTIIASTPPPAAAPTPTPAPKTLANNTPPPTKPSKKESGDQLDAAFDQLFKR